ncbi:arginine deiminase family protein [Sphingosinicella sp.]|uniref:dimethylarginine dimethylaminohydrolase family protein n=1 Tax=Sphingosinicella sp. TaxID=1917971 RepID=UPI0025E3213C|nr:arginine deiminase family protein [Sphingosinicella sp.]
MLTDVMISSPDHYVWLPNCAVAREAMGHGARFDLDLAKRQHEGLRRTLEAIGAKVHEVPPRSDLPDLCFTRDTSVMTPWGLMSCRMAMPERVAEVDAVENYARALGIPLWRRIASGCIEGGDVCLLRPGLALIGVSGERTMPSGAAEAARAFRDEGWDVHLHAFEPFFLHLDTYFCMVAEDAALACIDVIDDDLLDWIGARGVHIIPVSYKEMRRLGANVLALGDRRVLAAAHNRRISTTMRETGLTVIETDITQFTLGGGGVHCLTMALGRARA